MDLNRFLLIAIASLIFCIGLVMIFSTTSAEILDRDLAQSTHQALMRQVRYALVGMVLGYFIWRIGYLRFLEWSPYLLALFSFLLLLTLIPGIGKEVNGSRRWIGWMGLTFQPSEFVKILIPAYFIQRFVQKETLKNLSFNRFLKLVFVPIFPILLILIEPNNGTAAVNGLLLLVLFLLLRIPFRYWATPLLAILLIGSIFAYNSSYVSARLKVYWNPELDLKGKGHQPYQAKIATGAGQLFGKGPGNSWQKLSYLPEAQNDYIAAIFAEEFGFLGISFLIALYALFSYFGFTIAMQCSDQRGSCLAGTISFLVGFQAFLNLAVVSGLLPSTGLNLPFFSQGGSSLMSNIVGIALLSSISMSKKE